MFEAAARGGRAERTNEDETGDGTEGEMRPKSKTSSSLEAEHGARTAKLQKDLVEARGEKEILSAAQQRGTKRKRDEGEGSKERREAPSLPEDVWRKILEDIPQNDLFAFASTSKQLRRLQVESGRKLVTNEQDVVETDRRS